MRIVLFIISLILLAEAVSDSIHFGSDEFKHILFVIEVAAEEEPVGERDSLNADKFCSQNLIYNTNIFNLKQFYPFYEKNNLPFDSHIIFSPPPES
jgi:hypothetical protein